MKTANAMQLKARINNKAREAGVPPQALMQNYLIERLLVRLSKSEWNTNVVVKGGMLISSLYTECVRAVCHLQRPLDERLPAIDVFGGPDRDAVWIAHRFTRNIRGRDLP